MQCPTRALSIAAATVVLAMGNAPVAHAANYYFANGSGNGNGSLNNPYTNLSALDGLTLGAGDNVYLRGGDTFNGNVYFDPADGGTAAQPVTLTSYGTGRATIQAGSGNDGIFAYNNGGFSFSNFNVVGNGYTSNTKNGISLYNDLAGNVKKDYLRFDNLDISGFGSNGLVFGGYNGSSGYNDVRITNVASHDNGKGGISSYGFTFNRTTQNYANTNVYVGNSRAYNNRGLASDPNPSGNGIVLGSVNNGVIERSVAYNNGINNVNTAGPVGIWTYDARNVVIQHNESYANRTSGGDGDGFDLDINTTNCVLQFNYSHDNDGAGYLVYSDGGRTSSGNVVRYNISQNDGRKLAYAGIMIAGGAVNGVDVYNNTVYLDKTGGNASAAGIGVLNVGSGSPTNVRVLNNIIQTANGATTLSAVSGTVVRGNDYFAAGSASPLILYAGTQYGTLAAFRLATGQEMVNGQATGFNVDPKLMNAGGGGTIGDANALGTLSAYTLLTASQMRDAGLNLQSLFGINPGLTDFYGVLIPNNGAYDIGASEFLATAVPEPAAFGLLCMGGLALLRRRRQRA